jgi:DNA-binding CsgD family transcriptional regulator
LGGDVKAIRQRLLGVSERRWTVKATEQNRALSISATPHLTAFTDHVGKRDTPSGVLDALNELASKCGHLSVLGAARFPIKGSDWRSTRLDRDVFLHSSAPEGWWDEYAAMAEHEPDPGMMMAKASLISCTWTETMKILEPIGIDRWPHDLALRHGMRDGLTCSVGRRWVVVYWSAKVLTDVLTPPNHEPRWPERARITPRELAVLRLVAMGKRTDEVAKLLGLGDETVRSHLKKVQTKLGVRNRTHAAVEAVRQQLIP